MAKGHSMIGPLPESNSFNAIEVFTDTYSHHIHVEPSHIELSVEGFANLVRDRVIRYHGLPEVLVSDQGPQTVAKAWASNSVLHSIYLRITTPKQTDRQKGQIKKSKLTFAYLPRQLE